MGGTLSMSSTSIPPLPGGTVASVGSVTFSVTGIGSGSATIDAVSGLLTALASGQVLVSGVQGGDVNYYQSTPGSLTITIGSGSQTLALTSSTGSYVTAVDGSLTVTASSNVMSGGSITYSVASIGSGSATVDATSGVLFGVNVGSVVLTASTAGNANYMGASISQTITINKGSQTLTISPSTSTMLVGSTLGLIATTSATGGRGGLISYTIINDTGSATVTSGGIITAISSGTVTFTASSLGDSDYTSASSSRVITISKGPQTLTMSSISSTVVGGTIALSYTTSASASSGGLVTYSVLSGSGSASIDSSSGVLRGIGAGSIQLEASTVGDTNYTGASVIQTITIGRGTPILSLLPLPPVIMNVGGSLTVTGVSGAGFSGGLSSTGVISYSIISGGSLATINASTGFVTALTAGTIVVEASQSSDANYYSPVPASLTISILQGSQELEITSSNMMSLNGSLTASASSTALDGGGVITYSITSLGGIATIDPFSHVISAIQGGQVILTASSSGDVNYLPASTSQTITIVSLSLSSITSSLLEGSNGSLLLSLSPLGITLPSDVTFSLFGSVADPHHYSLPSSVVLQAGQSSVSIPVQALQDQVLYNGDELLVTATTANLNSVSGSLSILDGTSLDAKNLVITIGNGTIYSSGSVELSASLPSGVTSKRPIDVNLVVDASSQLSLLGNSLAVPSSVTIPVDSNAVSFNVSASNKGGGVASVYLDGSSVSFTITQGEVSVLDKELAVGSVLSSNGDGVNDCWYIGHVEKYPLNTVSLYDRNGVLVWHSRGYNNGSIACCGVSNRRHSYVLPSGPYYYVIEFLGNNGTTQRYFGSLEIRH